MNAPKLLLYFMVFLILILGFFGYQWQKFIKQPLIPKGISVAYELKPKMSIYDFAEGLHHTGVLTKQKRNFFIMLAYFRQDTRHFKTGEYLIEGGKTPDEILKKLINGQVIQRHITFLEGWDFQQMLAAIQANTYLHHTLTGLTPSQIMDKLGHPNIAPEGLFFPDTYFFTRGTPDTLILKKSFLLMQHKLEKAWNNRTDSLPYKNAYESLIAASMIEKESGFKLERPLIASVLLNRLKSGMPLQIDSTVSYGLGGVVHLTKSQLKEITPYNTYLNKGWPPTPIAMPSLNAIEAALHPQKSRFVYFVATDTEGHHFSKTLPEHHAAVMRYKVHIKKLCVTLMPSLLPKLFAQNFYCYQLVRNHLYAS